MKALKIPEATVIRISVYSRYLSQLLRRGVTTVSSGDIAEGVGVSPAQVRKDLAYFGEFGTRGVGYNVRDLHRHVIKILGLSEPWPVIIVGAGNLGTALCMYGGFRERGFQVVGIFDSDPRKVGYKLNNIEVYAMDRLAEIVEAAGIRIAIVAVPAEHAQDVADMLSKAKIQGILNFAPKSLNLPDEVELRNVDLSVNLEVLTFNLCFRRND